jgi:hypothetical protein
LKNILFCSIAMLLVSFTALAQKGTIRGVIYDKESGEPIIFSNVVIEGTTLGAATDVNGIFTIPNVPVGNYNVISFSLEHDSISTPAEVKANKMTNLTVFTQKKTVQLSQVEINAEREEAKTEVKASTITVTTRQITRIPNVGGEPDLAQYLQVIPGIVSTGDQGGQLYIRGGSPIQTKVLLDGVTIYNPFHSIGLFSVFETDLIKSADVYTGGFSAQYGQRISSIVDIKTRDGNKKRFGGKVSASPFLTHAILEGPLMKQKENGSAVSFILSAKNSFLDKTSKSLYPYVNDGEGMPFSFNDYYGKLTFSGRGGTEFNLFGFHFNDVADYGSFSRFEWNSLGIGSNFTIVPEQSSTIISGMFAYSNYDIEMKEQEQEARNSSIGGFNIAMDFTYFVKDGELKYGFNINGFKTTLDFTNSLGLLIEENQNTTEFGLFFQYRKAWRRFVIEPSFRIDYYASLGAFSPEPRLGLKYNATDFLRFKFAGGIYSQNFISTRPDKDVVNLFNGFLSGPEDALTNTKGEEANNNLQKAYHAIGGVEIDVAKNIQLNVEPYYKRFQQLIELNRFKQFPTDPNYQIETGDAYGIDFSFKYDTKKYYLWASYSLAWVQRDNGQEVYYTNYDRRHNVNIVASYNFGKDLSWEASARWNFGTGFPFTRTQGYYPFNDFSEGITTDYTTGNSDLGIIYEDKLNAGRLPTYHRLDLGIKKKIEFKKNLGMEIAASVTNVYNRANIFYVDRVTLERVNQLPILPSLSVGLNF